MYLELHICERVKKNYYVFFFKHIFFQAEDGIRDIGVTGVQSCALPISRSLYSLSLDVPRVAPVIAKAALC